MSLKELIQADIRSVFLNTDEVADLHIIDGDEITCIIDEDKSNKSDAEGVFIVQRNIFVHFDDLGYRPEPEQKIEVDGQFYYVVDCVGNDMLKIVIKANLS